MNFRTDLALERQESAAVGEKNGVISRSYTKKNIRVTEIRVLTEQAARALQKPVGRYITLEIPSLRHSADADEQAVELLSSEISALLPDKGTVLVAGLGNGRITPDAVGPETVSRLLATRHIAPEVASSIGFGELRSVAGIVPGVLGNTGIEAAEIIKGVVQMIRPACLIVIDALASRSVTRLGTTVQMCDSGVVPGSGVGNARARIDEKTMGVPVIAIGVPTVVDAITMTLDFLERSGATIESDFRREYLSGERGMLVTPKEIDNVISRCASFMAMGINKALQPHIPIEDITAIMA